jgi:dihydroorotase
MWLLIDVEGELDDIDDVNEKECLDCISKYPDEIIGIKIRLATVIANDGKNEKEAFRRALSIASQSKLPIMVHHAASTIPISSTDDNEMSLVSCLKKGDIRTHMHHRLSQSLIDNDGRVLDCVVPSIDKGIVHDVGHGQGSFVWSVAESCARESVWPHTISTDLHKGNVNGPAYDLPIVMSKLLHLGMPLYEVIKAVTINPAVVIRKEDVIGSLSVGRCADVTVLRVAKSSHGILLEDCDLEMREMFEVIEPIAVWKSGEKIEVENHWINWPNKSEEYLREQNKVRDWK